MPIDGHLPLAGPHAPSTCPPDILSSPFPARPPRRKRAYRILTSSSPSAPRERLKKSRGTLNDEGSNDFIDLDAEHSGSDISRGTSNIEEAEGEVEDEEEGSYSSMEGSYDQQAVYAQSLLPHAPSGGPVFFQPNSDSVSAQGGLSSPSSYEGQRSDEYSYDGFVVPDNEF